MARIKYYNVAPEGVAAMMALGKSILASGFDPKLKSLVEIRVSQINGCAFCLNMHAHEAREAGEDQQRLDVVAAWRDTKFFTEKERAALQWAERLTMVAREHPSEEEYQELLRHFDEKELVNLTLVISTINAWNRISIGLGAEPEKN